MEDIRDSSVVIQGGGMRGVYSMGALEKLATSPAFEQVGEIVGSSSGALNSHYVVSGQPLEGVGMYTDDLSSRDFINPMRFWRIVNIDFLIDEVQKRRHPMDHEAFRRSPVRLRTIVADAETADAVEITNRDDDDPHEVMRATAALPALYNRRVPLAGRGTFVDGGVADSLPIGRALERHPSLVFVLTTRPKSFRSNGRPWWYRIGASAMAVGQSEAVKRALGGIDESFNEAMALVESSDAETLWEGPGASIRSHRSSSFKLVFVSPSDLGRLVGRTTFDRDELVDCANMGREDMERALLALGESGAD